MAINVIVLNWTRKRASQYEVSDVLRLDGSGRNPSPTNVTPTPGADPYGCLQNELFTQAVSLPRRQSIKIFTRSLRH